MEQDVKKYADTLFESAPYDSSKVLGEELKELFRFRAKGALSEAKVNRIADIYKAYVNRCMVGRLESYQQAYRESDRTPSSADLDFIWKQCQEVGTLQTQVCARNAEQLVANQGGSESPIGPMQAKVEASSAGGHEDLLRRWKQWKARLELKVGPTLPATPERRKDVLLPLLNRAEFDSDLATLTSAASESSPLSLIFMDLDKFKSINDGPGGHAAGDRALKAFAEAVAQVCSSKGTAYRWGGDELCVLLPNHSVDEAHAVAERIRRAVAETKSDELPNGLRTSVGVATFPAPTQNRAALCPLADAAMYESKKAGGNRVSVSGGASEVLRTDGLTKEPRRQDIKKQLSLFLKECQRIRNGIEYSNPVSIEEKAEWEKRVEQYLTENLDESYAIRFQIPTHQVTAFPDGINSSMLGPWRNATARMAILDKFLAELGND
jgi:diguanylate cyclase (GGDEF)-like protein